MRGLALVITLALALGARSAAAEPATASPRAAKTGASPPAVRAHHRAPRAAHAASDSLAAADTLAANGARRRLKDVHIEGEAHAPQVLFISPSDPRRVTDFQHHRYLPTSRAIGELGAVSRIAVVDASRARPDGGPR